jgi:hypothetical protein
MSRKKLYHLSKWRLPKNLRWLHDFDYINKLSPAERNWLNKFIKEYYDGNVKKGDLDALHNTTKLRKDCYNRKNLQNRDLTSILNCGKGMDRVGDTQKTASRTPPKKSS